MVQNFTKVQSRPKPFLLNYNKQLKSHSSIEVYMDTDEFTRKNIIGDIFLHLDFVEVGYSKPYFSNKVIIKIIGENSMVQISEIYRNFLRLQ